MQLSSARLRLMPPEAVAAAAVAEFLARNAAHFAPWEPPRPADIATEAYQQLALSQQALDFAHGQGWRWYAVRAEQGQAGRVLGKVELSGLQRGPSQSAKLGYSIDAREQGQGLASEMVQAVLAAAFSAPIDLHRLQAACRPENLRSARLLERLGFRPIGVAEAYLFIDGAWRDHRLYERVNRGFEGVVA